jgi:hypothetical protein
MLNSETWVGKRKKKKKNTRCQYGRSLVARRVAEPSDIDRVDQERSTSQIAAITLAEMTLLYYPE